MPELTPEQINAVSQILGLFRGPPGQDGMQGNTGYKGEQGDPGPKGNSSFYSFSDDFGADPTGMTPCDAQWQKVIDAKIRNLYIPGIYRMNSPIVIPAGMTELSGDGRYYSGFLSYSPTDGLVTYASPQALRLKDFIVSYNGSLQAAGYVGFRVTRKVIADGLQIKGFPGDGIYADSTNGTVGGSVFFAHFSDCYSTDNGRDGFALRFGANGWLIENCQFSKNKRHGFHHYTDGGATYNTTVIGGQAAYNGQIGWNFENGTSIDARNIYAEYNGTPTNTNTDGYTNTPFDYFIGDNCNHSWISLGALLNNDLKHVRAPLATVAGGVGVFYGPQRVFGSNPAVAKSLLNTA